MRSREHLPDSESGRQKSGEEEERPSKPKKGRPTGAASAAEGTHRVRLIPKLEPEVTRAL